MALKSTIFKVELQVADVDRGHYATYDLTLARHPSENDDRMMLRVLAFALFADSALAFGRGISTDDEPDLWQKDLTGRTVRWIQLGQPDEREVRKACARADEVVLVTYGGPVAEVWWDKNCNRLERLDNLTVLNIAPEDTRSLGSLAKRTMSLQVGQQDGDVLVADGDTALHLHPIYWKSAVEGRG